MPYMICDEVTALGWGDTSRDAWLHAYSVAGSKEQFWEAADSEVHCIKCTAALLASPAFDGKTWWVRDGAACTEEEYKAKTNPLTSPSKCPIIQT